MKYLMVSTYPPMKCGIGTYACQMVRKLRNDGHIVDVLSPEEGDGDFNADLKGGFNLLKILKLSLFYDRVIIQYHPSFFYQDNCEKNLLGITATYLSFYLIFIIHHRKLEVIVHEFPRSGTSVIEHFCEKTKWSLCPRLVFHTQKEIDDFASIYFTLSPSRYELRSPNAYFYKFRDISKADARKELNVSGNALVFLCIGFIQPHKGFDRAIAAFQNIHNIDMQLYVVGSLRLNWGEYVQYLQELKRVAKEMPNIHVLDRYLSDEDFDTWISASDVMVIPYREIWSSGVLGRAKLFGKPVIASDVGGLSEQLSGSDILFSSDDELAEIFKLFKESVER